jgi:hypothetical protein
VTGTDWSEYLKSTQKAGWITRGSRLLIYTNGKPGAAVTISRRVTDVSAPEVIEGNKVSANFFSFFGAQAAMGRVFLPEDEKT